MSKVVKLVSRWRKDCLLLFTLVLNLPRTSCQTKLNRGNFWFIERGLLFADLFLCRGLLCNKQRNKWNAYTATALQFFFNIVHLRRFVIGQVTYFHSRENNWLCILTLLCFQAILVHFSSNLCLSECIWSRYVIVKQIDILEQLASRVNRYRKQVFSRISDYSWVVLAFKVFTGWLKDRKIKQLAFPENENCCQHAESFVWRASLSKSLKVAPN